MDHIFLVNFLRRDENDLEIESSYIANELPEKMLSLSSPDDIIIQPYNQGDGYPYTLDLQIKVRVMDINKYNAISTENYSSDLELERTKQSLCPFLIKPIQIEGLVTHYKFIPCVHLDTIKIYFHNFLSEPIHIEKGQKICNLLVSNIITEENMLSSKLIDNNDFTLSNNFILSLLLESHYSDDIQSFTLNIYIIDSLTYEPRDSIWPMPYLIYPEDENGNMLSDALYMPEDMTDLYFENESAHPQLGFNLYMPYNVVIPPRENNSGKKGCVRVDFYMWCSLVDSTNTSQKFIILQSDLLDTKMYSPAHIYISGINRISIEYNNLGDEPIILQKGMSYNKVYSYTSFVPIKSKIIQFE